MSSIGRGLRRAGYSVRVSRGERQWRPRSVRDTDELARFVADVHEHLPGLGLDTSRNFLDSPAMLRALVRIKSAIRSSDSFRKRGCCVKCHVAWEERVVWPYLSVASVAVLDADHDSMGKWPSPSRLRQHGALEVSLMTRDKVPRPLISEMVEHHANLAQSAEAMGPWGRWYRRVKGAL